MAKSANQKLKLLVLAQMLETQSDEEHPLTVQQLIDGLSAYGISAERKSIYDDIQALEQFGMDIVVNRGRSNSYYVGQRSFQLPELKLLVDAVQSAKFITEKKSRELIAKIGGLASRHEAAQLERQVVVRGRAKTENESIYYNVDTLQSAMLQNKKIEFYYFEWVVDAKARRLFEKRPRREHLYCVSPWALIWDDQNYYLVAYDTNAGMIKHYRTDKMEKVALLQEQRDGQEVFASLDMAEYTRRTFSMYGGVETQVKLRFANHLIGVVVDRFGKDIQISLSGDAHFTVVVRAVVSPQFLSWVLGFGAEAQVMSPPDVVEQLQCTLQDVQRLYDDTGNI